MGLYPIECDAGRRGDNWKPRLERVVVAGE